MLQVCAVDFTAYHFLRPLLRAARGDGWTVQFACADGPLAESLRGEGFEYRRIPMTRSPSPLRLLRATMNLAVSLRVDAPDLIHTHTPVGGFVGRAAAMTWRGPVVHTFHGLPFEGQERTLTDRLFLTAERAVAHRTTYFFSQAEGDASEAIALGIARAADTLVIGNGVDLALFTPDASARADTRRALGMPDDAVIAVTVARLVREKGILELADAVMALASDVQALHVLVVGEALPSDRTGVTAELDRHPVVTRLGRRWRRLGHRQDVPAILRAADLFVLPTYREGLPRSVIEAMAAGLPIITTDIPACRELVHEGKTGLLVPPRDAAALGEAIRSLATDPARRREMGMRARLQAEVKHDERLVLRRQLDVMRQLTAA